MVAKKTNPSSTQSMSGLPDSVTFLLGSVVKDIENMRGDIENSATRIDRDNNDLDARFEKQSDGIGSQIADLRHTINRVTVLFKDVTDTFDKRTAEILVAVEKLKVAQDALSTQMTDTVMPTVKKINAWEQRGIGILAVAGMAGAGLAAAVYFLWESIINAIRTALSLPS